MVCLLSCRFPSYSKPAGRKVSDLGRLRKMIYLPALICIILSIYNRVFVRNHDVFE